MAIGIPNQEVLKPDQPFSYILREIEAQSLKSCDDENGGCQVRKCVLHSLVSQPAKVFTMQLAWQTDNESKQDITAAMLGLREAVTNIELKAAGDFIGAGLGRHVFGDRA
ncbi:TPA: hypothetical protein ACH3X2_003992 [Trebouxia sp. C0005]